MMRMIQVGSVDLVEERRVRLFPGSKVQLRGRTVGEHHFGCEAHGQFGKVLKLR